MSGDEDISQRVKEVVVRALDLRVGSDEIPDQETIFGGGLGADSIATLEIVFAIEEEFGIEVEDEDLRVELFDSVASLTQYVREKLGRTTNQEAAVGRTP